MKLICIFADEEKGLVSYSYEQKFYSLNHIMEFLEFAHPKVFKMFNKAEYTILLQKEETSEPFAWKLGTNYENFNFEYVYFVEKVEGKLITTASIASFLVGLGLSAGTAAIAAQVIVLVAQQLLMAAIMYGIGQIMQALSPTQSSDSMSGNKNFNFNQIPNINTQGSYIPYNFGDYLCGGVVVGRRMDTYSMIVTDNFENPSLPESLPTILKADLSTAAEGTWYKIKSS